jgi:hypothetical protein
MADPCQSKAFVIRNGEKKGEQVILLLEKVGKRPSSLLQENPPKWTPVAPLLPFQNPRSSGLEPLWPKRTNAGVQPPQPRRKRKNKRVSEICRFAPDFGSLQDSIASISSRF